MVTLILEIVLSFICFIERYPVELELFDILQQLKKSMHPFSVGTLNVLILFINEAYWKITNDGYARFCGHGKKGALADILNTGQRAR